MARGDESHSRRANRALAFLSKMLPLAAKQWQLRADNPCSAVQRFPERERERHFSDAELTQIGGALAAAERGGTELPGFILLVRLLATTGMRLSELLGVQWRDATAGVSTDKQGAQAWPGSAESRVEAICHPADGPPAMSLYKSTLDPFSATLSLRAVSGSSCPIVLKNSDPPLQSTLASNIVIISISIATIIIYEDRNRN